MTGRQGATDPPGNTSVLKGDLILGQSVCGVTLAATTTTTVPTTTTTVPTNITTVPVEDCRPGWGKGDKNHCHAGPPGLTGDRPGNGNEGNDQGLAAVLLLRNASSESLLLGAVGLVILAGLILPLPRRRRLRRD